MRNKVILTGGQGEGACLRSEAFREDPQLKYSGRNKGKSKLTILIGLHLLNDGLRVAHKTHVGPCDAVADFIDNPSADSAVPLLLGRRGGG